ncbi:MAG: GAF domain-containing protein [Candidatus Velthaea sp.]
MSGHEIIYERVGSLFGAERDAIANAANLAAIVYGELPDVNWAGFYFTRGNELVLGPFQGKPACVRIAFGRGVCGTAWAEARTIVVPDVHAFAGHIACDTASNSEIVVPLERSDGVVVGVLDVDSPLRDRFSEGDRSLLEALAQLYVGHSDL